MLPTHTFWLSATLVAVLVPVAPARAQGERDAEARGLFDAGQSAYEAGRFADAERYFRESYELSGRAELLYNIALSAEQARHDQAAIEGYRAFLEAVPGSQRASRARTRLAALEQMIEPSGSGAGGASSGVESGGPNVGAVVLLASGGAFAIVGAVLVGLAAADVASVENAERGTAWADVSNAYERSEALSIAGFVLLGVGVAAATVGVVLLAMGGGEEEASADLRIGPAGISLEGAF